MSKTHELKITPEYFQHVWDKKKTFEVRKNDRDYEVGDKLVLREWDGDKGYSGSGVVKKVSYILNDPNYVKEGYVIMALEDYRNE